MAAAATDEDVLEIVAQAARDVIGARHGVARHRVHLSVLDDGPGFELPQRPVGAPAGPGGWGLYLVDRCAVRWGSERGERHRVWLELERQDAA